MFLRDKLVIFLWCRVVKIKKLLSNQNFLGKLFLGPVFFSLYIAHKSLGILCCNDLSSNVEIGNVLQGYHMIGVIVGSGTQIGNNVVLRARVVLGARSQLDDSAPIILDHVEFGIGAMCFGEIEVGPSCMVRAGSILTKDYP